MQPVNLAIAGLGFMGATHTRAAVKLDGIRLAAVVESNENAPETCATSAATWEPAAN